MPRKGAPKAVEIDRPKTPFVIGGVLFLGFLITGGTIMWAKSDSGAINVSATIANSQFNADAGADGTEMIQIATEEHIALPNGGLRAQGDDSPLAPTPEPPSVEGASTTATTTADGTDSEADTSTEGTQTEENGTGTDEGENTSEPVL